VGRHRLPDDRVLDLEVLPAAAPLLRTSVLGRPLRRRDLAAAVGRALHAAGAPARAAVGLVLADDATLAGLNAAHMGHEGATDVLSFPLLPPEAYPPHPGMAAGPAVAGPPPFALPPRVRPQVGEIVVSVERAVAQARDGRGGWSGGTAWDPADELLLLATHGALHLCGWDHADPVEGAAMRALEAELLAAAGGAAGATGRAGPGGAGRGRDGWSDGTFDPLTAPGGAV
jgi:probable rRNA maturation factor